ncbi:MAG: hypothetical protein A2785_03270 [Candidatus Chisholmbacteria bacterium RIFCSPHIGHO2_01_FULL_49_18]|uniref:Uncharacterized protein n=1 Tax=Candidatus Chisholmbacteria bacterium RIFCSPHIGHO2_01_FULL_49_18 TaxID=1797590 RepID=A0A1G1VMY3_9BACT|nr:MAG: hypothetical protein A2785_03270 [Candidatus Chisholmbacteria bacterium RIFCSPHIGHO2_01_FULL_49_18]
MNHESAPIPFLLPEIVHDQNPAPCLLDLEFRPQALAELKSEMSQGRLHKVDRIIIRGGLVLSENAPDSIHTITIGLKSDEGIKDAMQYAFYKSTVEKYGFSAGYYNPQRRTITINPDTQVLMNLIFPSESVAVALSRPHSSTVQSVMSSIKTDIHQSTMGTIIEELEHSYQKGIQHTQRLIRIIPLSLLGRFFDMGARDKKQHPRYRKLAQETLTLESLISDKQLLEYALFARSIPGNQGIFLR